MECPSSNPVVLSETSSEVDGRSCKLPACTFLGCSYSLYIQGQRDLFNSFNSHNFFRSKFLEYTSLFFLTKVVGLGSK